MLDPPEQPCSECDAEAGQECALDCPAGAPSAAELTQDWVDVGTL